LVRIIRCHEWDASLLACFGVNRISLFSRLCASQCSRFTHFATNGRLAHVLHANTDKRWDAAAYLYGRSRMATYYHSYGHNHPDTHSYT
jgi:hypothetical protein